MEYTTLDNGLENGVLTGMSNRSTSRRSSNSSVDTVRHISISRQPSAKTRPCEECIKNIFSSVKGHLDRGSLHPDWLFGPSIWKFASVDKLRKSANTCPMCHLLWSVLSETPLVSRFSKYNDDKFNSTGLYLPDGGTDIDELVDPGPRVKLASRASMKWSRDVVNHLNRSSLKARRFRRHFRRHIDQVIHGVIPSENAGRDFEQIIIRPFDDSSLRSSSLTITFDVSYKSQAGPRRRPMESVSEDLAICRVQDGSDSLENKAKHLSETRSDDTYLFTSFLPLDWRTTVDEKWNLLASWTRTFSKQTNEKNLVPSRYLDLSQKEHIKLVNGPPVSYVALSHRWGASQHLTARAASLDKLRAGIPLDLLPRTFRDAVSVARQLGVYGLWIDALCIVQDDKIDWRNESKKMGDIYMNATFIIAVHCAADDSQGFLHKAFAERHAVYFERPENKEERLCVYRHSNFNVVTESALSKRGWVLQERFLATHTLHFTKNGVFSETASEVLSEDGPVRPNMSSSGGSTFHGPGALPALRQIFANTATDAESSWRSQHPTPYDWLTLVEMYTNCDLTREEDKLIAISGMARKLHSFTGNSWYAGLWSDQISFGLLWLPAQSLSCPTTSRAPTWSWAAWDGAIQYPDWYEAKPRAQYVSVHEQSFPSTPTTWLEGPGILRILAKLIALDNVFVTSNQTQLGPGPDRRGYLTTDQQDLPRLRLNQFIAAHTLRGRRFASQRLRVHADQLPPCGWLAFDVQPEFPNDDSYVNLRGCCFVVLSIDRVPSKGLVYLGLYLRRVGDPNQEAPEYERIGCGQLSHSFMSNEDLKRETWRSDELSWSTKPAPTNGYPIPPDLSEVSIITIR